MRVLKDELSYERVRQTKGIFPLQELEEAGTAL